MRRSPADKPLGILDAIADFRAGIVQDTRGDTEKRF